MYDIDALIKAHDFYYQVKLDIAILLIISIPFILFVAFIHHSRPLKLTGLYIFLLLIVHLCLYSVFPPLESAKLGLKIDDGGFGGEISTQNPNFYHSAVNRPDHDWNDDHPYKLAIQHIIPADIPSDAKNIVFSYEQWDGIHDSEEDLKVSYHLPAKSIAQLAYQYSHRQNTTCVTKWLGYSDDDLKYLLFSDIKPIPKNDPYCNHSIFVAISKKNDSISYEAHYLSH